MPQPDRRVVGRLEHGVVHCPQRLTGPAAGHAVDRPDEPPGQRTGQRMVQEPFAPLLDGPRTVAPQEPFQPVAGGDERRGDVDDSRLQLLHLLAVLPAHLRRRGLDHLAVRVAPHHYGVDAAHLQLVRAVAQLVRERQPEAGQSHLLDVLPADAARLGVPGQPLLHQAQRALVGQPRGQPRQLGERGRVIGVDERRDRDVRQFRARRAVAGDLAGGPFRDLAEAAQCLLGRRAHRPRPDQSPQQPDVVAVDHPWWHVLDVAGAARGHAQRQAARLPDEREPVVEPGGEIVDAHRVEQRPGLLAPTGRRLRLVHLDRTVRQQRLPGGPAIRRHRLDVRDGAVGPLLTDVGDRPHPVGLVADVTQRALDRGPAPGRQRRRVHPPGRRLRLDGLPGEPVEVRTPVIESQPGLSAQSAEPGRAVEPAAGAHDTDQPGLLVTALPRHRQRVEHHLAYRRRLCGQKFLRPAPRLAPGPVPRAHRAWCGRPGRWPTMSARRRHGGRDPRRRRPGRPRRRQPTRPSEWPPTAARPAAERDRRPVRVRSSAASSAGTVPAGAQPNTATTRSRKCRR